jgi:ABC-type dipeptide/oligopeptide/nickel transport system permease subunit
MPDIQKADPVARHRALLIMSVAALIGVAVVLLLEHYRPKLEQLLEDNAEVLLARPEIIAAAFLALMLPMYVAAIHLWRHGTVIVASQRFPPPGQPVVRDTAILAGRMAVYRGRIIQALALARISHRDPGCWRRARVSGRRAGAKVVAVATT